MRGILICGLIFVLFATTTSVYAQSKTDKDEQSVNRNIEDARTSLNQGQLEQAMKYSKSAHFYADMYMTDKELRANRYNRHMKNEMLKTYKSVRDFQFYSKICDIQNNIAKVYWKERGNPDKAKEIYRDVIKMYKIETEEEALRSCVNDAEFALEDIGQAKTKIQEQETAEIRILKKENELLKKENELLKAENESLKAKTQSSKKKKQ